MEFCYCTQLFFVGVSRCSTDLGLKYAAIRPVAEPPDTDNENHKRFLNHKDSPVVLWDKLLIQKQHFIQDFKPCKILQSKETGFL